jgi:hypothetical protein
VVLIFKAHGKTVEDELFWEALHFRPAVLSLLNSMVQNKKLDDSGALKAVVTSLKTKFKNGYFVGPNSVVDFVIWCDLYGIFNTPGK